MPRILIADDHALFRRGIEALLLQAFPAANIEHAESPEEVLEAVRKKRWDLLLLDFSMPGRSGTELIRDVREFAPRVPILVVSGHPEEQFALEVLRAGASGFVNKARPPQEIAGAVKKVMAGERYITPEIAQKLAEAFAGTREQQLHETLSNREMEVLRRIAEGKTVKEIAGELKLSVPTVGTYRARLLEKMGLKTNGQLMRYALDHRLAD